MYNPYNGNGSVFCSVDKKNGKDCRFITLFLYVQVENSSKGFILYKHPFTSLV